MSKQKAAKKEDIINQILEISLTMSPDMDVDLERRKLQVEGRPAGGKQRLVEILKDLQTGKSVTSAGRLEWDAAMIETLLKLRLQKHLKVFEGSKSTKRRLCENGFVILAASYNRK